jgi:hypothetical protein
MHVHSLTHSLSLSLTLSLSHTHTHTHTPTHTHTDTEREREGGGVRMDLCCIDMGAQLSGAPGAETTTGFIVHPHCCSASALDPKASRILITLYTVSVKGHTSMPN